MENIESDLISTELPKAWATSMDTFIAKAKMQKSGIRMVIGF